MAATTITRDVQLTTDQNVKLDGRLVIPQGARAVILFAHGSGSSRFSPRNQFVADALNRAGLATLLFDLLTRTEEECDAITRSLRFDIPMLGQRLLEATNWALQSPETSGLKIGYFGASTGAAAALIAAAGKPEDVFAVVSRGGRPDLAGPVLGHVMTPTLLIVGGNDEAVIDLNHQALRQLATSDKQLEIIPGAGHLFEEPGKLEEVARLAAEWFTGHLRA